MSEHLPSSSENALDELIHNAVEHIPGARYAGITVVSAVPLQQALADADRAYRIFFDSLRGKRKGRKVGAPRFKSKRSRQSARFTRNAGFKIQQTTHGLGFLTLPKIGRIRFNLRYYD